MRIANLAGRLVLIDGDAAVDVAEASDGRFDADVQACFERWPELLDWVRAAGGLEYSSYDPNALGPPAPAPRQVFAIGLNYATHASEAGFAVPDGIPPVFTKFPTCLTGPYGEIALPPGGHTDWEVELVVVIGRRAEHVPAAQAWEHVAGLDHRAGPVRAGRPVHRAVAAVQPRQVVPRLRPARPSARDSRRIRRSGRPRFG